MPDLLQLDDGPLYQFHELIFVNSGSSYYVRLPINHHAAIYNGNNGGKTSSLAALKLFLLPYNNFKKTEDKFQFQSGGKSYGDLQSYQYYFPGQESFIILHASNPRNEMCWVLYRSTDLGYERIAVPKPYSEIEHLFFNTNSAANEGAGRLHENIKITEIRSKLCNKIYGGKRFTETKEIGQAIYGRCTYADEATRFCLLPLGPKSNSDTPAKRETVRSLLHMAFNLGDAGTGALPQAIASIIDSGGMSAAKKDGDGVFLDIDTALSEWNDLKRTDTHLKLVESLTGKWDELITIRSTFQKSQSDVSVQYTNLSASIFQSLDAINKKRIESKTVVEKAEKLLNQQNDLITQLEKAKDASNVKLEVADKNKRSYEKSIESVIATRGRLQCLCESDNPSDSEILEQLNLEIEHCKQEIRDLKDTGNAMERMQELIGTNNTNIRKRCELEKQLLNFERSGSFLSALPTQAASVLQSLNRDFIAVNVAPSDKEKETIVSFTGLFSSEGKSVSFLGSNMPNIQLQTFCMEQQKAELSNRLTELKAIIKTDEKKLAKMNETLKITEDQRQYKLKENEKELRKFGEERNALMGSAILQQQLSDLEEEIKALKELVVAQSLELEAAKTESEKRRFSYNAAMFDHNQSEPDLKDFAELATRLEKLQDKCSSVLIGDAIDVQGEPTEPDAIADKLAIKNQVSILEDDVSVCVYQHQESIRLLNEILQTGVLGVDKDAPYYLHTTPVIVEAYFEDLAALFDNLQVRQQSYKERLSAHNHTSSTSTQMIANVEGLIQGFVKDGINQNLSKYRISNLDGVELVVKLHPQYSALIKALRRNTNRVDELLPEDFYRQISAFQQNFFDRRAGKIDLTRIIESISYSYLRNGKRESVPQSNGTNSMISAVLLALLLEKLVPGDLKLVMAVIFDEVGKLDERNLREVVKVVNDHGLILFAANPEPTGVIASVLEVSHDLSLLTAQDVPVHGVSETIYYPGFEDRLESLGAKKNGVINVDNLGNDEVQEIPSLDIVVESVES